MLQFYITHKILTYLYVKYIAPVAIKNKMDKELQYIQQFSSWKDLVLFLSLENSIYQHSLRI